MDWEIILCRALNKLVETLPHHIPTPTGNRPRVDRKELVGDDQVFVNPHRAPIAFASWASALRIVKVKEGGRRWAKRDTVSLETGAKVVIGVCSRGIEHSDATGCSSFAKRRFDRIAVTHTKLGGRSHLETVNEQVNRLASLIGRLHLGVIKVIHLVAHEKARIAIELVDIELYRKCLSVGDIYRREEHKALPFVRNDKVHHILGGMDFNLLSRDGRKDASDACIKQTEVFVDL